MNSQVEKGTRIKYTLSLYAEITNIFDNEEINCEKKRNILLMIKEFCADFREKTGMNPSTVTLDSVNFYTVKEALDIEYPDNRHYGDTVKEGGLLYKGGCSLKDNTVIISSWSAISPIIEA